MGLPKPALVAIGGVGGATTRWAVVAGADHAFWSLLAVNTLGAFLLGTVVHGVLRRGEPRRLLLGVGFCGALTTYSTFAVEIATRLDDGRVADAFAFAAVIVAVGAAAAFAGAVSRNLVTR